VLSANDDRRFSQLLVENVRVVDTNSQRHDMLGAPGDATLTFAISPEGVLRISLLRDADTPASIELVEHDPRKAWAHVVAEDIKAGSTPASTAFRLKYVWKHELPAEAIPGNQTLPDSIWSRDSKRGDIVHSSLFLSPLSPHLPPEWQTVVLCAQFTRSGYCHLPGSFDVITVIRRGEGKRTYGRFLVEKAYVLSYHEYPRGVDGKIAIDPCFVLALSPEQLARMNDGRDIGTLVVALWKPPYTPSEVDADALRKPGDTSALSSLPRLPPYETPKDPAR
jgi:hypothetical protein